MLTEALDLTITRVRPTAHEHIVRALAVTSALFDALETGIVVATASGRVLHANDAFSALVGLTPDDIVAMTADELVDHVASLVDHPPPLLADRRMLPIESRVVCEELTLDRPSRGVVRWVARRIDAGGTAVHLITCADITAEVELTAVQQRSAQTDRLTGLTNRRGMEALLAREHARITRGGASASVLLLDVDHFKRVNDEFGHAAGDEVLRRVALAIRHLRPTDCAGRWGGEEFLILLPGTSAESAQVCAERVRQAVEALVLPCGSVTISGGIAELAIGESVGSAIARADQLLYAAKANGRNQIR